jgi:single-strand DNA-binding protein
MTAVTIIGNIASDIDLRFTNGGKAVANFSIAENNRVKRDGEWVDGEPTFWRCSLWDSAAENLVESLTKGQRVIAHGEAKQRTYDAKDGTQKTVIEVTVTEIGASLRWAVAKVDKRAGNGNGHKVSAAAAASDPWGVGDPDSAPF